ncbi:MAG: AAA family ATPase [Solobacterium sp.]|nr:AAA family ATPase [Solobacterium sp.]
MKDRSKEKERLMREVLNKDRSKTYMKDGEIVLTTDSGSGEDSIDKTAKDVSTMSNMINTASQATSDLLKNADRSFDELRKLLVGQQKDLEELSKDNGFNQDDMERVQKEIEQDYGLTKQEANKPPVLRDFDSAKVFGEILTEMDEEIVGQDEALEQMCVAFRRPYVMGVEEGKPKNVILVTGPRGSGRHACVTKMAKSLFEHRVIGSDDVYTVDMSLYQSGAQEGIFLQDLYKDLSGHGEIICFENFEVGFPGFLRMVDSLVCEGKVTLSKRYVLNKGILVENQTGLVKDAVDSLSAAGKYLVFITSNGTKAVQNAFGANFLYHVLDIVTLTQFTEEDALEYTERLSKALEEKANRNLKIAVNVKDDLKHWVVANYDKTNGADALNGLFDDFYISLSQAALIENLAAGIPVSLEVKDGAPSAVFGERSVGLSRSKTSAEEIEAVNKELDEIVGLEEIKAYIKALQNHIRMQEIRKAQGMKTSEISKHMIFTGNPGTGKTTIARLLSRYMKAIGALTQGQLVEVTRADLVAQYVGQTAPLTMSVIKSAIGGVLFIDEAYSLYRGKDDSFGLECIDTIVKAMEDNRDNLIVILAGYSKEMEVFLESNSGLKSRFPNTIHFPDYTGEELRKIAVIQAKGKGYVIEESALGPLEEFFDKVQSINAAEAGNGRLARNVVEDAILKQSGRVVNDSSAKIDELKLEDFDLTVKVQPADEFKELREFNEMLKNAAE